MAVREYEYEFTVALYNKLRERINGDILTRVLNGDVLFIRIRHGEDRDWYQTYPNLTQKIFDGWSTDECADDIVKAYRKEVLKQYFKTI